MNQSNTDAKYYFIELQAFWQGLVNSPQISQQFKISRTQAQKYLAQYQQKYKLNLTYQPSLKGFITTPNFTPNFINCDANEYLDWLDRNSAHFTQIDSHTLTNSSLSLPKRKVLPHVIRALIHAIQQTLRVEVDYVSLTNPDNQGRVIQPHVFVKTGLRWHLRAYDEKHKEFRDFVLSRFTGQAELMDKATHTAKKDTDWNTFIDIKLVPDSRLSPQQKNVIQQEYMMQNGQLIISTRAALAHYLLQEMQVNIKFHDAQPEAQQLVLANKKDIQKWLFSA